LVGFEHLANAGRADRMTVTDQTAACVHWNLDGALDFSGRTCGSVVRAALHKLDAFPRLGEAENFVGDNFCDGKTIVNVGAG